MKVLLKVSNWGSQMARTKVVMMAKMTETWMGKKKERRMEQH
jgi:hypothetical protein